MVSKMKIGASDAMQMAHYKLTIITNITNNIIILIFIIIILILLIIITIII